MPVKRALVCGASKGIGRAIALELKSQGYQVHALARSESQLKNLGVDYTVADFLSKDSVASLLQKLDFKFHVLVCNSGGPAAGPLLDAKVSDFESAFQSHLYVNHQLMQKCVPFMKSQNFGRVITILSTSVKAPLPNLGVSNTLRAAMASWAKTLAGELGPFGITVNNILPGYTKTDRLESLKKKVASIKGVEDTSIEKEWLESIPAKRFAEVSETAKVAAFLASLDAGYINGVNLPVDGGRLNSL